MGDGFEVEMSKLLSSKVTFLCLSDQISAVAESEGFPESVDVWQVCLGFPLIGMYTSSSMPHPKFQVETVKVVLINMS